MNIGDHPFVNGLPVRLDGGRRAFRKRWGYDIPTPRPPTLPEEHEEDSSELSETTSLRDERLLRFTSMETSYEKACSDRRGSAPATPVLGLGNSMDTTTPSRFANFFSKRSFKSNPLKRTKSVTKLERKRCTIDGDCVPPSRLRTSRSHESLLQSSPSSLATLDLSHGDVQVSALHSSLLGQDNCFQMISNGGTRFYTCRTKEERDRWLYSLKKTIQPNQDSVRRKENSLRIWILEAKGIVAKKNRYYCELCLDKTLYARTSSKQKGDMCFWGEHFEFSGLPSVETVFVNLYREADKKKRRDKNVHIGSVHIPVSSINGRHLLEKWYPVIPEKVTAGKDTPSIRIKSRFQTVEILPLVVYKDLLKYLKSEYKTICEMLEPVISVRAKEDVATTLINIMQRENMAKDFLADVVMSDIEKIGDLHLTFRGNSLATKATEAYMKLLGDKYLQETLGMFLKMALDSSEDCEVDPMKVTNNTVLQRQQSNLMTYVEMVWVKIINSANSFPSDLQEVFYEYRKRLTSFGKEELGDNLISASIFLRFLCPAILSPSLFNLSQEYPQGKSARNLTLVAKTVQTLANFTRFGGKESFMEFMNGFVEREWSTMKSFLRQISSPSSKDFPRRTDFDGYIDLGKELAIMHNLLSETLTKVNQKCYFDQIDKLHNILDSISSALNQPPQTFYKNCVSSVSSPIYDKSSCANMKMSMNRVQTLTNECSEKQVQERPQPYLMNSIDVRNTENDYHSLALLNCSPKPVNSVPSPVRPATLPRNAYLMGSAKRPATDLSTSDDYVLYSAFDSSVHSSKEDPNLKNITPSSLKRDNVSQRFTQSCIYGEALNNKTTISHSNGVSASVYSDLTKKILNEHKSVSENYNSPQNGIVLHNVLVNSNHINTNEAGHDSKKRDVYIAHDEDIANSSGEMEVSNAKGSQISIGQLSTVASSGYQSFPYSQSNSPVDLTYQQDGNSMSTSAPPPLAFNNPMYHFQTSSVSPLWECSNKLQRKHLRLSHLNSLSAEDISILCRSSIGFSDSSPVLPVNRCYCSSSSSGTASCNSTPPAERRNSQFKSTAPRTNPRYSGSQHACHAICAACSPRLHNRAFSHPLRSRMNSLHDRKHSEGAAIVHHPKAKKNLNLSSSSVHSKHNLNLKNVQEDISNCNTKAEPCNATYSSISIQTEITGKTDLKYTNKRLEYESEIHELRVQLMNLQSKLSDAENKLSKQETTAEKSAADWQARLEAGEERIRKQQEEKDHQTRIITRLITVEEELKKEQQKMQNMINAKQKFIEAQERKIQTLDAANKGLLNAVAQLRDRYQLQGRNGTSVSSPNSPAKLAVLENIDGCFKSSSC